MISQFVSKSAASRIFKISLTAIARIECWANVVLVVFKKGYGSPRFVSYRAFERDAAEFRLAGALALPQNVTDLENSLYAVEGSKGDIYLVDLNKGRCDCADSVYRSVRCKHQILASAYQSIKTVQLMPQCSEAEAYASLGF